MNEEIKAKLAEEVEKHLDTIDFKHSGFHRHNAGVKSALLGMAERMFNLMGPQAAEGGEIDQENTPPVGPAEPSQETEAPTDETPADETQNEEVQS